MSNITYIYRDGERSNKVREDKLLKSVEIEGFEIPIDTILQLFKSSSLDTSLNTGKSVDSWWSVCPPSAWDCSSYLRTDSYLGGMSHVADSKACDWPRGTIIVPILNGKIATISDMIKIQRIYSILPQLFKDFHLGDLQVNF